MTLTSLDRALIKAWLGPFVLSLSGIVLVLFLAHVRKLAAAALGAALTWSDLRLIVGGLLPPLLVFALPLANLAAVLLTLGRMADDGELAALAAAGASPWRVARAPVLCSILVAVAGLPIAHWAQPAGWRQLQSALTDLAVRNVSAALADAPTLHTLGETVLTAAAADGPQTMTDLVVLAPDTGVLVAARGHLRPQPDPDGTRLQLVLDDGEYHPIASTHSAYHRLRFDRAVVPLDIAATLQARTRLVSADGRLSTRALRAAAAAQPPASPRQFRLQKMAARRTALPALALVFGLVAAAIAWGHAGHRWPTAGGAVLGYYLLMRAGDGLIAHGGGAVEAVVWGPHVLLLALAGAGLWTAGRPR